MKIVSLLLILVIHLIPHTTHDTYHIYIKTEKVVAVISSKVVVIYAIRNYGNTTR